MAEVWLARSRGVAGFEKTVVIKRVLPSLMSRPHFAELLVREARIAALLNHPGIVQIFELGEEAGAYFIAMEHVPGCDLATALMADPDAAGGGPFSLALRLWIVAEAAKALDYAHRTCAEDGRPLHIVHRDISPQNVLLGYAGQVKIADFGIALADESGLGRGEDPTQLWGKYAYMSPEQARGENLDRRSDIFSLGIVLYELLAGRRLFRGTDRADTLARVQAGEVPPLDCERLGLPPSVDEAMRRALCVDRNARFESAGRLADALARGLVTMGARVGDDQLVAALEILAPPDAGGAVNKLSGSLSARAGGDARASWSLPPVTENTASFPTSRRIRSRSTPVVLVVARPASGHAPCEERFEEVVRQHGGMLAGDYVASFGHVGDVEHAPEHAVHCGLELIHHGWDAAIGPSEARVLGESEDDAFVEPDEARCEEVRAAIGDGVCVDPSLAPALVWRYLLGEGDGGWPVVEGFRSRGERTVDFARQGRFVGRGAEMARLEESLHAAVSGRARPLVIEGVPGVGKSRVVAELAARGVAQGCAVFLGRGLGSARRFGLFAELFADLIGVEPDAPEDEVRRQVDRLRVLGLSPRDVAFVAALLGAGETPVGRAGRPRGIELVTAMRKALRTLASEMPLIVIVEDLQRVDDESRQVLDLLFSGLAGARILPVAATRPGATGLVADVERIELSALEPDHLARVISDRLRLRGVEEDVERRLHELTAGLPGAALELADSLHARGLLQVADGVLHDIGDDHPIPPHLSARVDARISALEPEARSVVDASAAFRREVDLATLAALTGQTLEQARFVAARLTRHGLLRAVGSTAFDPGRWGGGGGGDGPAPSRVAVGGGEIVQRAVHAATPPETRRRLHLAILPMLERIGAEADDRVEDLAWHAGHAGDAERERRFLDVAATRAADHARYADAAAFAWRGARVGEGEARVALGTRAVTLALRAGLPHLAGEILADLPEPAPGSVASVALALARARTSMRLDRWDDACEALQAARASAESLGDDALQGEVLYELGRAELERGALDAAVSALSAGAEYLDMAGAGVLVGRALSALAIALARSGDTADAKETITTALSCAVRFGDDALRVASLAGAAEVAEAAGEMGVAAARWCDAAELARSAGLGAEHAHAAARASVAMLDAGEEAHAAVWAATALESAQAAGLTATFQLAEAAQAAAAIAVHPDGHFIRSLVTAAEALAGSGRMGDAATGLALLARGHLAFGDVGAAIRTLGRAEPMARAAGRMPLAARVRAEAERLAIG